jgi:DNA-directed RNA polymerase subunit RPC12/RpoP
MFVSMSSSSEVSSMYKCINCGREYEGYRCPSCQEPRPTNQRQISAPEVVKQSLGSKLGQMLSNVRGKGAEVVKDIPPVQYNTTGKSSAPRFGTRATTAKVFNTSIRTGDPLASRRKSHGKDASDILF